MSGQFSRPELDERTREVDVKDLERRGLDKVKVLRTRDIEEMILQAVQGAVTAGEQDRGELLASARRALEAKQAEAEEQQAAAAQAAETLAQLSELNATLEGRRDELREKIAQARAVSRRHRKAHQQHEARRAQLEEALATAEGASAPARARKAELDRESARLKEVLSELERRADGLRHKKSKLLRDQKVLKDRLQRAQRTGVIKRPGIKLPDRAPQEDAGRSATGQGMELPDRKPEDDRFTIAAVGKGLDVGTANLIGAAQDRAGNLYVRSQRNAFIDVDPDDVTRNMLTRLGVQYVKMRGRMLVVGDAAFDLANILNKETRRPMAQGVISAKELDALPIMQLLIERLIGRAQREGELCYYSVPADPIDFDFNASYHQEVFKRALGQLGYEARPQIEGHAVVLSELADDDFTGIGISCGGGMHNVCVAYKAINVLSFSTARGGDWIDQNVAQVLGVKKNRATAIKERAVDIRDPKSREEQAVAIYYRELITYTLKNLALRLQSSEDRPDFPDPVDVVFAGGTSRVGGYIEVVRQVLQKLDFPIPVKEVRLAEDPLNAIAKGCLVAAMSSLDD